MKIEALCIIALGIWIDGVSAGKSSIRRTQTAVPANVMQAFLVSGISDTEDWCITATNGSQDFANVGFRECDFVGAPSSQKWHLDADGKVHSGLDFDKCLIVGFGKEVFDGVRIRIASCDNDLNKFSHNGGTGQLRLGSNPDFCVVNRGVNPNPSDTIHALPCSNEGRFTYTYKPDGDTRTCNTSDPNIECCSEADCASGSTCESTICVRKGNPTFRLIWQGGSKHSSSRTVVIVSSPVNKLTFYCSRYHR